LTTSIVTIKLCKNEEKNDTERLDNNVKEAFEANDVYLMGMKLLNKIKNVRI
jgi:hypothetical protein